MKKYLLLFLLLLLTACNTRAISSISSTETEVYTTSEITQTTSEETIISQINTTDNKDLIKKVAYIPLDDRPVNLDRVSYLIESNGYDILIPDKDLYQTKLDKQPLNKNNTAYGDMDKLLAWLANINADMYVISLDQLISGGLVNSRCMIEENIQESYNRIDQLVSIIGNKTVVVFDTVMRLASTVGYNNYTMLEYTKLREYASISRPVLNNYELNIDNIKTNYLYTTNNDLINTNLTEEIVNNYLNSRLRKLKIIDYYLDKVKNLNNYYTYIGVDDSSPNNTIQTNEINYLINKIENGILFAGCDELGLMSVTKLLMIDKNIKISANITYIGGGEDLSGDSYDIGSLKENVEKHLSSLNVKYDKNASLQILILTKPKTSSQKGINTDVIINLYRDSVEKNNPVILIDASTYSYYGVLQPKLLEEDLSYLLGYSNWNTVGNAIGIALSNGISRYMYLISNENANKANYAFVKTLTFSLLKDISYKITGQSLVKNYITQNVGDVNNFYSTSINEVNINLKLEEILLKDNYSLNMSYVINKINNTNFIIDLNQNTQKYNVTVSNFSFPWYRSFEIRFCIDVNEAINGNK